MTPAVLEPAIPAIERPVPQMAQSLGSTYKLLVINIPPINNINTDVVRNPDTCTKATPLYAQFWNLV